MRALYKFFGVFAVVTVILSLQVVLRQGNVVREERLPLSIVKYVGTNAQAFYFQLGYMGGMLLAFAKRCYEPVQRLNNRISAVSEPLGHDIIQTLYPFVAFDQIGIGFAEYYQIDTVVVQHVLGAFSPVVVMLFFVAGMLPFTRTRSVQDKPVRVMTKKVRSHTAPKSVGSVSHVTRRMVTRHQANKNNALDA